MALFSPQGRQSIQLGKSTFSNLTSYKSVKAMLFVHISLERKEWLWCFLYYVNLRINVYNSQWRGLCHSHWDLYNHAIDYMLQYVDWTAAPVSMWIYGNVWECEWKWCMQGGSPYILASLGWRTYKRWRLGRGKPCVGLAKRETKRETHEAQAKTETHVYTYRSLDWNWQR